ncbi:DHA2 family efflux MFS transporter permease subunit [Limosilactobacillus gastricus]|uniref:Major facilitator superfamily permease n=1 Tax=Limosilactobacillus gastricus DSM 16045 TaxID=1423749 RepID=A0A0R1V5V7_9LACO|nr:MDR family MFS transporter [Limosilactobacillus gastricus]KRM00533.1 Major facilitator superfamily permease [Limosilactobacillus gastricus DSM 16045]QGF40383.1 DHA2 family efflux MFS transporter permease subunit [Limosilactobacillus gastricus]
MEKQAVRDINNQPYNRLIMVIILMTGSFCTVLNQTILATAYPTLMRYFSVNTSTVQWLTTGFLMVNGMMIPVSAYLSNRLNTKYLYLGAMVVFEVGTVVCWLAPSFAILLVGRLIQALAVGVTVPLIQTIMLTIFPPEKRGTAMGYTGIVVGLAPAIGPTLSGFIIDTMTWRDLFRLIAPIVLLVIVLGWFFIHPVLANNDDKLDLWSLILSTFGFGLLLYGFSVVGSYGWSSPLVIGSLIVGAVIVAIMFYRQLKISHPFLEIRVFKHRPFIIGTTLSSIVRMAMVGVEMIIPIYLQNVHQLSAFESGLVLLPGAAMFGLLSPLTGRIFDKYGAKYLTMIGMTLLTVGTLLLVGVNQTFSIIWIALIYLVRMVGISMVMMPASTAGMNSLPLSLFADGSAVNNTIRQVAAAIGTALMTSVLDDVTRQSVRHLTTAAGKLTAVLNGYHAAFLLAAGFAFIGIIIASFFKRKQDSLN